MKLDLNKLFAILPFVLQIFKITKKTYKILDFIKTLKHNILII